MTDDGGLVAEEHGGWWRLGGTGAAGFELVNEYLGYLADRDYSPRTVRAYAFDLLHFCPWLAGEGISLDAVTTEVLLGFLASCRDAAPHTGLAATCTRSVDGRNTGFAPATINRRLAAISGLFTFRPMREPGAASRCRAGGQPGGPAERRADRAAGASGPPEDAVGAAGPRAAAAAPWPGPVARSAALVGSLRT